MVRAKQGKFQQRADFRHSLVLLECVSVRMAVTEVKKEPIENEEPTLNLITSAPSSKVCSAWFCMTMPHHSFSITQIL